ncbi:MAG: nucleotidyltransferase family protein [Anaerolineales bacterium]|jgi:molybdenum cofactor cytidylyltransferase
MIAAVVLAAGESTRMGQPKMVLPWGETTVIGHVVQVLSQGGVDQIVVVTGGAREQVEEALHNFPVHCVFNSRYTQDEMLLSLRTGLSALPSECQAAMVALGDQPQIKPYVVQSLLEKFRHSGAGLVIPSYKMRRGHPWILAQDLWQTVYALPKGATMRDLIQKHAGQIVYLQVDTPSILRDLDTPEEYRRQRPKSSHQGT